jgi:condensin complex subunit 1
LNGSAKKIKGGSPLIICFCSPAHGPQGSLLDKTLRIEMDNAIFRRLQETVEHPCRSKDWFGLAEQAINTIYALSEHPDVLCNDLIKNLTVRAFSSRSKAEPEPAQDPDAMDEDKLTVDPDTAMTATSQGTASAAPPSSRDLGDAFELSQLLFIVGHVAIKHIVFLELVEREWKRQKDEKQAGIVPDFIS